MKKKISIIGSTGSIGQSALDVVREHPEEFQVRALAAGKNLAVFVQQIAEFRPCLVSVQSADHAQELQRLLSHMQIQSEQGPIEIAYGDEGLTAVAAYPDLNMVLTAVVGVSGLRPTLAAAQAGIDIALANKETLVAAGSLVQDTVRRTGSSILPVDSEHSAIFQCLQGEKREHVKRLILTSSGGPFRQKTRQEMSQATVSDALQHPTWSMGAKITIDSATLMNKGLEVMEAHWLFQVPFPQIEVLVHPQSIIHSMVEFADGSNLAQLGTADMRLPIQYALSYPARLPSERPRLNLAEVGLLTFEPPDLDRFPCLKLCYAAGVAGGTYPAVVNAANEVANALFRDGKIPFLGIENILQAVADGHDSILHPSLDDVLACDEWARNMAFEEAKRLYT